MSDSPAKSNTVRAYVAYRRAELAFEERELAATTVSGIGGGYMVSRGERLRAITILLEELDKIAAWLDAGEPEYVPPLSESDKNQWRWAREHGLDVPSHIEQQL
jgi:hypothetical protein